MAQDFLNELISPGQKSNISFEESLLWKYSELARLSYKDGDIPGYQDVVDDKHEKIIGKKDGQEVWVGFRGSGLDPAHWVGGTGNLHALPNNDSVCRGFSNAMQKFHDSLKSWCEGSTVIHLTGHSRGGAFATLAGWLLANDFKDAEVNVVVFGCPRVGTSTFAKKFRERRNLRWAGFQHAGDHVGKVPPWGQHVHPPADPLTDFQTGSSPLLQSIPMVGNALNVMWVFGSNLMKNHSMQSYHQSLKCNFILRSGAPDIDELIDTITNQQQKAMLTIGVQAVKASTKQIQEQVRQAADELKDLLSADRLKEVFSQALIQQFVIQLAGTTSFLADMYSTDSEGMKKKVHDLEEKLHILVKQLPQIPQDSTEMLKLLLEAFFKGGFVLVMCRMELGDRPVELKKRFMGLVKDVKEHLWRLANNLQDADAFYASLPSLVQLEAACAAHLDNREPLFVTDNIQEELLPHHLHPTKIQQDMRKLKNDFKNLVASEGPGGVAKLLSSKGLGENFVRLLEAILKDVASEADDEHLKRCHEEVKILEKRMDDLLLPEVVLTGPTNGGKSSLANALLGKEIANTTAVPDSFLPIRFIAQAGGKKFHVGLRGQGLKDRPDLFKDKLDEELKEILETKEVNTAEEVHEAIKNINTGFRDLLDSETFGQKFLDEEKMVLSQHLCVDWSVDIKIPVCSQEALPVILVDLPGSTEGGLIGEFVKTMVRGSCIRASTALLLLTPDMITELDRKGPDLMQRFFGGASNFSGYYIVITKVFDKEVFHQVNRTVRKKAARLEPEPLGIRFINSYLLRAHAASSAGPLPEKFPSLEADAGDEQRRWCQAEQQRFQNIFWGVQNRGMIEMDQDIFSGKHLDTYLEKKLKDFPETAAFTSELYSSVDQRFPELFWEPHLAIMQRHIEQLVNEIHQHMEICSGSEHQRQTDIDACHKLLSNLDAEFMEPVKEKAELMIRGKIEKMAEFDLPGRCDEETGEFYNEVSETFGPEVADWCCRNVKGIILNRRDLWVQIGFSAMGEITKAFEQILCQELAELTRAMVPNPGEAEYSRCSQFILWIHDLYFAVPVWAGFATITAISRALEDQTMSEAAEAAKAEIVATLINLWLRLHCLNILSNGSRDWVQATLERRLRMLEEQPDARDVPHLEEKLQKNLQALANLQEISAWVKEEVKQRTTPTEDAGVDGKGTRLI